MNQYVPELGQAVFGQPWSEYEMPDEWLTYMETLGAEVARVVGRDRWQADPTSNSGAAFYCQKFSLCSYRWDEDDAQPNFRHHRTGLEVRWYKYLGRGTTTNDPSADFSSIFHECLAHLLAGCSFTTDPTEHKVCAEPVGDE